MQVQTTTSKKRGQFGGFDTINSAPRSPLASVMGQIGQGEAKNSAPFTTPVQVTPAQPIRGVGDAKQDSPFVAAGVAKKPPAVGVASPAAPGAAAPAAAAAQPDAGDFSGDPVLARARALAHRNDQAAVSAANSAQKQALIDFGDPTLARKLGFAQALPETYFEDASQTMPAGVVGDEDTALAAAGNPNSTVAQLLLAHQRRASDLDNQLNTAGGFFSSARANAQGGEGAQYQSDYNTAANALSGQLGSILSGLMSARQGEGDDVSGAWTDAYGRALDWSIAHPSLAGGAGATDPTGTAAGGGAAAGAQGAHDAASLDQPTLASILGAAAMSQGIERANAGYEGPLGGPIQAAGYSPAAAPAPVAAPALGSPFTEQDPSLVALMALTPRQRKLAQLIP